MTQFHNIRPAIMQRSWSCELRSTRFQTLPLVVPHGMEWGSVTACAPAKEQPKKSLLLSRQPSARTEWTGSQPPNRHNCSTKQSDSSLAESTRRYVLSKASAAHLSSWIREREHG